ncbi:hypothetical protein ERUR111494_07810 [Erysipelothrix urinaevulpis]|uniref:hypothetical protein n=1 Tax=Erysipelothrix urinaevulpis TaxID=2683717 RepID=UPI001357554B|nr:hypothetical protein [Erysipelothrix urinaevulpis]
MFKNHLKNEKIYLGGQFALGVIYIVLGFLFIYEEKLLPTVLTTAIKVTFFLTFLVFMVRTWKKKDRVDFLISLGAFVLFSVSLKDDYFLMRFIARFFGVWALFNAAVHGLEIFIRFKTKQNKKIVHLLKLILNILMASILLSKGLNRFLLVNLQIAIYTIYFGLVQILSSIRVAFLKDASIRLSAPVFLAAMIPNFLVKRARKEVLEHPENFEDTIIPTRGSYISIYVYAKDEGYNRMGHLDFGYEGKIYSYGAHDQYNRAKTMAYGDGVLIVIKEEDYAQFSVDHGGTVVRFLCELDDDQNEAMKSTIQRMLDRSHVFDYPVEKDENKEFHLTHLLDYSEDVEFRKFNDEPFKTYNVFTTNCVLLVEETIQRTGMKLFQMSGVITPGAYYEYLNSLMNTPGSIVVKKDIYFKK